jgi:hypothetical protein
MDVKRGGCFTFGMEPFRISALDHHEPLTAPIVRSAEVS